MTEDRLSDEVERLQEHVRDLARRMSAVRRVLEKYRVSSRIETANLVREVEDALWAAAVTDEERRKPREDEILAAASAIYDRFVKGRMPDHIALSGVGQGSGRVVVYCRRPLGARERCEIRELADGVPVEFRVTGDMRLCSE